MPIAGLVRPSVTRAEVLALAQRAFDRSYLGDYDLQRQTKVNLDKNLLTYAQMHFDNRLPPDFYPIGDWEISWQGDIETKKEGLQPASFLVKYDFSGKLVELQQDYPGLQQPPNYKESEALRVAQEFFTEQFVDAGTLTNKSINRDSHVLTYDLTFSKQSRTAPELWETYDIRLTGRNVAYYRARITFDPEVVIFPESYQTSEYASLIMVGILWASMVILILITFFKRLRHDVLEFRRAFWLGFLVCFTLWPALALQGWPDPQVVLLGGGIAGTLAGLSFLIVYATADSLTRDSLPERLALTDLLCRGFIRVRELGQALLQSLTLSGAFLLSLAGVYWLTGHVGSSYLKFEGESLVPFQGARFLGAALLENVTAAFFLCATLFLFAAVSLRRWLHASRWYIVGFALLLDFAGLHFYHVQPTFLSFLIFLPFAFLIACMVFRVDIVAIFLSLFTVYFLHDLVLIGYLSSPLLSMPSLVAMGWVGTLLCGGVLLIFSERSVSDFQNYVPSYLSRITERERFLKELEIARTVQLRFLPQAIPSLPNLDIACICQPAMEVGGDYYDFVQNGNGSIGVIIGDVSGKGVSAAFYMTMAKGIIKTISKTVSSPKEVLSRMNTIFYENVPKDVFISVIYGEFDLDNKVLRYARAGHNPLIVFKKSKGMTELLVPKGLAIGLDSGTIFSQTIEQIEIPLEKDDLFVFYTDGISESTNSRGDEFGEERLTEAIAANNAASAKKLTERIHGAIRTFAAGTTQHDDLTMVAIRVRDI